MRIPKDELKDLDMSSVESETVPLKCYNCHHKQDILTKTIKGEDGEDLFIRSQIGACRNPKCFRFIDRKSCPSWKTKELTETVKKDKKC